MKIIKGKVEAQEVFFVTIKGTRFVWSKDITDAAHFEAQDAEDILEQLTSMDNPEVSELQIYEPANLAYVYNEEVIPAIEQLNREFNAIDITQENIEVIMERFQEIIEDWGLPYEYLNSLNAQIKNKRLAVIIPPNAKISRVRTLH